MQNVFEMSAGTRDAYERAVAAAPDDAVFRLRFERFFPEFYEPLERLYGAHPAFEEQLAAILATMVGAHADRDPALRRLDHEREITPTGSSASGMQRLHLLRRSLRRHAAGRARAPRLPARARRHLPAPDAAAAPARRARTTAATRWPTTTQVDPRLGTMDDLSALAGDLHAARHEPVRRPGAQPHRARARVGRSARWRATRRTATSTSSSPTATEPDAYERTLPRGVPRLRAGELHLGRTSSAAGCGRPSTSPVGPGLREPGVFAGDARHHARPGQPRASTCCGSTPRRSCGSGWAPTARTSRRPTCCCRPSGR